MPLIDGIGDEVMQFGIAVIVLVVAVLAWLSTNARPDRYRAVILMRSRGHAVTVSIRSRQGTRITRARPFVQSPSIDLSDTRAARTAVNSSIQSERGIPLQEMDSIVDADLAMMDNNRLHFYRRVRVPAAARTMEETASAEASETAQEPEPAQNDQIREMDSIVSAMEADLVPAASAAAADDASSTSASKEDESTAAPGDKDEAAPSATHSTEPDASNQRKILIKLKYINDTLKEVEGSLDEPLKDFKCRHFSAELSSESRVRLIFNGRVLLDEAATLRACGLHDRAVVHCLVQPARPATPTQPQSNPERTGTMHEMVTEMINPERYWDLENILMTLISLALTVVWFFRCEYSNMFTASASVALFGLTVFYSVAIFGLYLSDTFHFDRRPARQRLPRN